MASVGMKKSYFDTRNAPEGSGAIRLALVSGGFVGCVLLLAVLQPGEQNEADAVEDGSIVARSTTEFEAYETLSDSLSLLSDTLTTQPETVQMAPAHVPAVRIAPASESAEPTTTGPSTERGLEHLIVSALSQGQSDAYIDALVNQAAARGEVAVPDSLLTADGQVDTSSLLSALQVSGLAAGVDETYTIQPGDSLKAISYRFFGSTAHANSIFNANRDILASPTQLEAGLQIIIPAL